MPHPLLRHCIRIGCSLARCCTSKSTVAYDGLEGLEGCGKVVQAVWRLDTTTPRLERAPPSPNTLAHRAAVEGVHASHGLQHPGARGVHIPTIECGTRMRASCGCCGKAVQTGGGKQHKKERKDFTHHPLGKQNVWQNSKLGKLLGGALKWQPS